MLSKVHGDLATIIAKVNQASGDRLTVDTKPLKGETKKNASSLQTARWRCKRSRTFSSTIQESKLRTKDASTNLFVRDSASTRCPCCINIAWRDVVEYGPNGPTQTKAWIVGKMESGHRGHVKPAVQVAKLTPEQEQRFGAEMVDGGLSSSQVHVIYDSQF